MKAKSQSDRRAGARHVLKLPALVRHGVRRRTTVTITTQDISSGGVFFFGGPKVKKGSEIDLIMVMPPGIERFARRWVCCQARVVRVVRRRRQFGVAAQIARCEALEVASPR